MTRYMLSWSHHIRDKERGRHTPGAGTVHGVAVACERLPGILAVHLYDSAPSEMHW